MLSFLKELQLNYTQAMAEGVVNCFLWNYFEDKNCSKTQDSDIKRIDIPIRYYPNCASDVWLRSCELEILKPIEGRVSGYIPLWLNGSLLRNGPGNWKVGDKTFGHLFDCSALLHRFAITNGHVTYQNRFVASETLKKNRAAQRIVITEFGTAAVPDPCHSIFDRFAAIFKLSNASDNSMISIYPFGDDYYTFTETPFMHRVNPQTLDTEERICTTDFVGIINHTSHPHILPNGTVYNLGMSTSKTGPVYNIVCFPHGEHMFENAYVVATIPCRWKLNPGYMHTFGMTENFFIIVEQPLSVSLMKYVKAQFDHQNFSSCLKWFGNQPTLIHLIDRKSGETRYTYKSEAFFYLHIINQYEEDNHVIIDICCYKDPEMINCMYLESIMNMQKNPNYATLFRGRPFRFVLPLVSNVNMVNASGNLNFVNWLWDKCFAMLGISMQYSNTQYMDVADVQSNGKMQKAKETNYERATNLVTLSNSKAEAYWLADNIIFTRPEMLCDWGCETPRIYYERYLGKKYRYFYAISSDVDAYNPGTLIKVDVINKSLKTWCEPNCYPSEPIFVPVPNAESEDDGIILSSMVVGGLNDHYVGLIVLDAKSMTELGRCDFYTNSPVPKCLHGWYAPNTV